jgi:PLP dependent protein
MTIAERIDLLRKEVPAGVKLIAVSKTRSVDEIMEVYRAGQRLFGENKAQELAAKRPLLPGDIEWHFIGHLQSNKVRMVLSNASMIQSIDSLKLLRIVDKEAKAMNRRIDCLLQFHIAMEETKFGLDIQEALVLLDTVRNELMQSVIIRGVMGMATYSEDEKAIAREFRLLKSYFDRLKNNFFAGNDSFSEISMGMSGDYSIALRQGTTMIRLGTVIFGERNYRT